jgi:hypothetical protein
MHADLTAVLASVCPTVGAETIACAPANAAATFASTARIRATTAPSEHNRPGVGGTRHRGKDSYFIAAEIRA